MKKIKRRKKPDYKKLTERRKLTRKQKVWETTLGRIIGRGRGKLGWLIMKRISVAALKTAMQRKPNLKGKPFFNGKSIVSVCYGPRKSTVWEAKWNSTTGIRISHKRHLLIYPLKIIEVQVYDSKGKWKDGYKQLTFCNNSNEGHSILEKHKNILKNSKKQIK